MAAGEVKFLEGIFMEVRTDNRYLAVARRISAQDEAIDLSGIMIDGQPLFCPGTPPLLLKAGQTLEIRVIPAPMSSLPLDWHEQAIDPRCNLGHPRSPESRLGHP